jgi:hypothetical protein
MEQYCTREKLGSARLLHWFYGGVEIDIDSDSDVTPQEVMIISFDTTDIVLSYECKIMQ